MPTKVPALLRVTGRSFVDWWDGWLDMVVAIIVWLLAQITIVFGPPATFGLYYIVHNMINGESLGLRGMIEGGRKYFWKAWLWGLVNLVVLATLIINYLFYGGFETTWAASVQIIVIMLGLLWYATQFYALPYFMELEFKKLRVAMRNGFLTTMASPFFTFPILLVVLLVLVLSIGLIIPFFLGLPAVIPFLGYRAMYNRLEVFGLRKPEKTPKEIEYEEGAHVNTPNLERTARAGASPAGSGVSHGEGQIEKEE